MTAGLNLTFLQRLTDRLVLEPTTEPLDPGPKEPMGIEIGGHRVEVWRLAAPEESAPPGLMVVKFPGTGGRAEWAGSHPLDAWDDLNGEVWAVNQRGYGNSDGPASLQNFSQTCDAVWRALESQRPEVPVVATGNSLGCMSALYFASRYPVAGLILRNGFSLAHLISRRVAYNWWNLWQLAPLVARQVPQELNAVANAKRSRIPCLFVRSEKDRRIPAAFQIQLLNAYRGPQREFLIPGADHDDPLPEAMEAEYLSALGWLRQAMGI